VLAVLLDCQGDAGGPGIGAVVVAAPQGLDQVALELGQGVLDLGEVVVSTVGEQVAQAGEVP